jgi:hypothetical protein
VSLLDELATLPEGHPFDGELRATAGASRATRGPGSRNRYPGPGPVVRPARAGSRRLPPGRRHLMGPGR